MHSFPYRNLTHTEVVLVEQSTLATSVFISSQAGIVWTSLPVLGLQCRRGGGICNLTKFKYSSDVFFLEQGCFGNKWPLSGKEQWEIPVTADQVLNLWSLLQSSEANH